jgi:hypothetical protein
MFGAGETFALELHISSYLMCCTYFIVEMVHGRFRAGLLDGGVSPGPLDISGVGSAPHPTLGWVLRRHCGEACMCASTHGK